ncbi:MAG: anaerobic ribonucleoside-triphosphate reductase [Fervidobacterium sp.]|mgnify:CR=1 FL=1|uniref:Ribonucleoside-triphosphate reductase n=1 Tax=Fervidobacterium gondwanense DSM 13020 TaxID=1121883 RepID=A0A1M7T701_FERGO|nr:anaerobic ribonucleoside-triphosphate reductase [Fervidobacterium gondwanense]UXF01836.1 ribonucleoside-triphosphate reductase [Fervidobacterium riparium]SHN66503.1 ribonucleoside-triphosphate reductase [Fervidobacterium gondwanense DSM 13020]
MSKLVDILKVFNFENDFVEEISQVPEVFLGLEGIDWQLDIVRFTEHFFNNGILSSTIDANANVRSTNVYTYFNEVVKPWSKLYSLYYIYQRMKSLFGKEDARKFLRYELYGDVYLHDAHHSAFEPYCYAYSLRPIVEKGLFFIDSIKSVPAKHLSSYIQHVIQFVMFASNQQSGAVGLPDFFVWLAYYYKKDIGSGVIPKGQEKEYLYQMFQIFTYSINQPIRGTQSPYTNFTYLDRNYIKSIFNGETYPDGTLITDYVEDIIALQKEYWQWISEEREKQMFTFPVLTASLLYKDGKFIDEDSARFINKVNLKWQDTNWYISDSIDAVASCCRLTSSTREIKFKMGPDKLSGMVNSIGGSDLNIGSFKVVTLNLPRIALEAKNKEQFLEKLREKVRVVQKSLAAIRNIIQERIQQGVLPLYNLGLMDLNRQYGTVGINGVYEAMEILGLTTVDIDGVKYTQEGEEFVATLLDEIRKLNDEAFEKYGFTYNIEQVPAEKAAVTFAQKDKILYGINYILYSNQWLPLTTNTDMLNRIKYSGIFDKKVSGGAILHINIDSPFRSEEEAWNMVNLVAQMGVVYFAFNQKISVCQHGHAFYGEKCPTCGGKKTDEYLRIVGYLVPVSSFNKVRQKEEYPKRIFY